MLNQSKNPILFQIKNIKKTYLLQQKPALEIDNFEIPSNCLVALIGYSGSGKTTLLNILGLIDKPDQANSSEIIMSEEINFNTLKKLNVFRRKTFGFVFQEGYLLDNLTGFQNVKIPLNINGYKINKENIFDVLKKIKITKDHLSRPPSELSGGEAQRISIARSIIHQPRIILADEPTSSLDYDIGREVIHFFKKWCESGNNEEPRSVIWATHNIHQAIEFADYIVVLKDGKPQGPFPNPKDTKKLINMLRQDDSVLDNKSEDKLNINEPITENFIIKLYRLMLFIISFAASDIFPKIGKKKGGLLARFGRKNAQKFNMYSLFCVLLFSLLILTISYAFKKYYIWTVSDPRINKIVVSGKSIGDSALTEDDRKHLASLNLEDKSVKVQNSKINKKIETKAIMGAYGIRTRSFNCYFNPKSKEQTMSGRYSLFSIAMNVEDPILSTIQLLDSDDRLMEHIKPVGKTVDKLFISKKDGKPQNDKEGVVITKKALFEFLKYRSIPEFIMINFQKAKKIKLKVLGVTDWLPNSNSIMISEDWYIKQYLNLGIQDSLPGYELINIYLEDLINVGIPVCNILESQNYIIAGDKKATLVWIKNLTEVIFQFSAIAILGIWILAGFSLYISYAHAIKKKQKEIGVLMAKGISKLLLYSIFLLEAFIVWIISIVFVIPSYIYIIKFFKNFLKKEKIIQDINVINSIFDLPENVLICTIAATLLLAFCAVFIGVYQVLKNNIAYILKSDN